VFVCDQETLCDEEAIENNNNNNNVLSVAVIDRFVYALFPAKNVTQIKLVHGLKIVLATYLKFELKVLEELQSFR
jgi:hypothetical protein